MVTDTTIKKGLPDETSVKAGYKQTELGVIPEDWKVVELQEAIDSTQLGGNYPNSEIESGFPLIKMGNIGRGNIDLSKIEYVSVKDIPKEKDLLHYGDVLFNTRNTLDLVGKVAIWRNELPRAYYNSNLMRMKFKKDFVSSNFYVNYLFNSRQSLAQLKGFATGTTSVAAIYTRDLFKYKLVLPKLEEQSAIATVLSDTDALIENVEKLIAKKKAIKQGTMQQLLTGKKRLPGFSGDWEVKKLGEIVDFSNGKAHENFISDDGDYIVVNSKFISSEGQVIKYSKQCFCPAPANSILLVMSDVPNGKAIAKCFLVDKNDKYTVNQRICALNPKIDARFLFYKINRNSYYLAFDDGVKQTNLRKDDVLGCKLSIPKEEPEQTAIATILSDMDAEIENLEQKRDKYTMLKQGMMQQLLTGRIRIA